MANGEQVSDDVASNQLSVDLALWGKFGGLPGAYPLVAHLLDAGAAVEVLWREVVPSSVRRLVAASLGLTVEDAGRLVAFWAALHDVGKATAAFQLSVPEAFRVDERYPMAGAADYRHDRATHIFLHGVLVELGYTTDLGAGPSAALVAQILGGHHGCFHAVDSRHATARVGVLELGGGEWDRQRRAMTASMREVFDPPAPPAEVKIAGAAVICGLVILADWLVSQEDFLQARLDDGPLTADLDALRRHRAESAGRVVGLVGEAGLGRLRLKDGSYEEEFPEFPPNALQRSVAEELPALVDGAGLLLVMAPMGLGKTETAFHAARLMGTAAGAEGMFFTLPTMATSDQMYARARAYSERRVVADASAAVALLHSLAFLNAAYTAQPRGGRVLTGGGGSGLDEAAAGSRTAATAWLRGRKRGLLAPLAIGTVDQALLTVLPVRHNVLRMLGLAGKVLVVDEVHAYDTYMQHLLCRLLTWLGAFGVPVVLLSATLPAHTADRMVRAYLFGARGKRVRERLAVEYPGWVYADAATGMVTRRSFEVREARLAVDLVDVAVRAEPGPLTTAASDVTVDPKGDGVDRMPALRRLLAPIVTGHGTAMVVCTTVAAAQRTYLELRAWLAANADSDVALGLLHARMPARERETRTSAAIKEFGRGVEGRPRAAILVATQVAEQSLDLDFDLVVSDLAPIAQLLQRAGRCQRHRQVDQAGLRPDWARSGPRLAVLVPRDPEGMLTLPRGWTAVYDRSLLRRTAELLVRRAPEPVAIPGDIQPLVEEVYDESFGADPPEDEVKRLMTNEAMASIAEMAAVEPPSALLDLEPLTKREIDEDRVSTRLGADAFRVICCYQDADGARWLDRARGIPLPERGNGPDGRFTAAQLRSLLGESLPLSDGDWRRDDPARTAPPPAWADQAALSDIQLLTHPVDADGRVYPAVLRGHVFYLDVALGLVG